MKTRELLLQIIDRELQSGQEKNKNFYLNFDNSPLSNEIDVETTDGNKYRLVLINRYKDGIYFSLWSEPTAHFDVSEKLLTEESLRKIAAEIRMKHDDEI